MTKVLVGSICDIDVKGSRTILVQGTEIALFRLTGGEVLAVENRCPHKGGLLSEGMVCGHAVHCPLHDWKIDLRSGHVHTPDEGCITTFPIDIDPDNGSIYVTI